MSSQTAATQPATAYKYVQTGSRLPRNFDMANLGSLDPGVVVSWRRMTDTDVAEPMLMDASGTFFKPSVADLGLLFAGRLQEFKQANPPRPNTINKAKGIPFVPPVLLQPSSTVPEKRPRTKEAAADKEAEGVFLCSPIPPS